MFPPRADDGELGRVLEVSDAELERAGIHGERAADEALGATLEGLAVSVEHAKRRQQQLLLRWPAREELHVGAARGTIK